ncbi:hypothetical protein V8F33_000671 [Rhypophila sp. PSN 637]
MEPKVDMTQSLAVRSKRTQRQNKKLAKKSLRASNTGPPLGICDLPSDLFLPIVCLLEPRDIITLSRVSRPIRDFIISEEKYIARQVIRLRYDCLSKCFRRPVLMRDIDPAYHQGLMSAGRPEDPLKTHKRIFHHIQEPDPTVVCTCLTCVQRWNSLCIVLDFAHWQRYLDNGTPIPIVPRGAAPEWNRKLLQSNAKIVLSSLHSDLFYARILQKHLSSITGSIQRHSQNKGNRRKRFRMTDDDVQRGTSDFLEPSGPPTIDFPHNRDNYYMLEAFLPNRGWITERNAWVYVPEDQHEKDLEIAVMWEEWAKRRQTEAGRLAAVQPEQMDRSS